MHNAVMEHQRVRTIVDNVTQALSDMQQAFALLAGAKARLQATVGHQSLSYHALWAGTISDSNLERSGHEALQHVTRNAWRYLVAQTGITAYMTAARAEQLAKQIAAGDLPALTTENVLSTVCSFAERTPELLQEAICDVCDWLRPRHDGGVGRLKTNQQFQIGPKVIIGGAVERWEKQEAFHLTYHRENQFRSLGNVLSLLDGRGVERYPHDLITRLNTGLQAANTVDDPYCKCTAYANGNLHVTFKRLDLVDEINRLAGGMQLGDAAWAGRR